VKIAGNQNEAKRRFWLSECIYRFISNVVLNLIRFSPCQQYKKVIFTIGGLNRYHSTGWEVLPLVRIHCNQ